VQHHNHRKAHNVFAGCSLPAGVVNHLACFL